MSTYLIFQASEKSAEAKKWVEPHFETVKTVVSHCSLTPLLMYFSSFWVIFQWQCADKITFCFLRNGFLLLRKNWLSSRKTQNLMYKRSQHDPWSCMSHPGLLWHLMLSKLKNLLILTTRYLLPVSRIYAIPPVALRAAVGWWSSVDVVVDVHLFVDVDPGCQEVFQALHRSSCWNHKATCRES
jgi:hypothetical protein